VLASIRVWSASLARSVFCLEMVTARGYLADAIADRLVGDFGGAGKLDLALSQCSGRHSLSSTGQRRWDILAASPLSAPGNNIAFRWQWRRHFSEPRTAPHLDCAMRAPFNWDSQDLTLQAMLCELATSPSDFPSYQSQGIAVYNGALMKATNKWGFKALLCNSGMVNM